MKAIVAILLGLAVAQAVVADVDVGQQWQSFKSVHQKMYGSPSEEDARFQIFRANVARIEEMNAQPGQTARFAINKFADLTEEEFSKTYLNYKPEAARGPITVAKTPRARVDEFDWRDKGAVTPVKDQGQCGSCWAFSAVEQMESNWFLAGNKLTELSTQQVVSCDSDAGDMGCNGGDTVVAYKYMAQYGLESEDAYPYTSGDSGSTGSCHYEKSKVAARMTNFTYAVDPCFDACDNQDEEKLKDSLFNLAPVSICVKADAWQFYSSGIFNDYCPHGYRVLNHCTQLTGFGYDGNTEYWKVRNSWGTGWGLEGYIHIEKGQNLCGVADEATIITI